jgi:predicted MFS family arabinose efflux permease
VLLVLAGITYGIIEGPSAGWTSYRITGCFLLGVAALAALLRWESRRAEPLIELRFFRSAPFSGATLIAVSAFASLAGFLFLNTIYLQEVRGLSPLHAGLYTLPMAAMTVIGSPLSGRLVAARGTRLPLLLAGVAFVIAILPLTRVGPDTPVALLIGCYVVFGFGFSMVNSPITSTAVSGMPREQAGVAAAIASTSRQVGGALGVAVIGAVVAARAGGFARASHAGWWIIVGLGAVIVVLGLLTTGRWARATTERVGVAVPG